MERDVFDPLAATVGRLGKAREVNELDQLWATVGLSSHEMRRSPLGDLCVSCWSSTDAGEVRIFAIREGWS